MNYIDLDPKLLIENPNILKEYEDAIPIGKMYNTVINPLTKKRFVRIIPDYIPKRNGVCVSAGIDSLYLETLHPHAFYSISTIPGTVGGLIYQNASCAKCISEYLCHVDIVMKECDYYKVFKNIGATHASSSNFVHKRVFKNDLKFGFRTSVFRKMHEDGIQCLIVYATFEIPNSIPKISDGQRAKYEKKIKIYNEVKHMLKDYDPLGCKGCIYRDTYSVNVLPKDVERNNLYMSSYGRSFWIPSSAQQPTFDDWMKNIDECRQIVKDKLGKEPDPEIEIIT